MSYREMQLRVSGCDWEGADVMDSESRDEQHTRLVRALFPGLATDLDQALEQYGVPDATSEFDRWLDSEAGALLGGAGAAVIEDPAVRGRFERAFAHAGIAAGWLREAGAALRLPEPESFAVAGVNLARLGQALVAETQFLPVPAPYGLGAGAWKRAFEIASEGDSGAPLALAIATEAEHGFSVLDAVPADAVAVPRAVGGEPGVRDAAAWTLRLIPSGDRPSRLGLGYAHGPHASLPEILMLQLMRLAAGEQLVDAASFTWLAGSLAEGKLAGRHVYDAGEHVIRITCREVGSQGPHMGSRSPVG